MELNPIPRRDKINYYLDIAETVLERGTCLRRNFRAIIHRLCGRSQRPPELLRSGLLHP